MTQPLPPDNDSVPEDLPLRHRGFRAREAENIRQAFIRSRESEQMKKDVLTHSQKLARIKRPE